MYVLLFVETLKKPTEPQKIGMSNLNQNKNKNHKTQ